jgi:hypothetical protein
MNLHSSPPFTSQPPPTGLKALRRMLRGQPAKIRGKVAAQIVTGEWPYQPSPAEAARIVETHARVVHAALGRHPKPVSDAEIDRLVKRIGPDRLMAALDRWTQPSMFSVTAE